MSAFRSASTTAKMGAMRAMATAKGCEKEKKTYLEEMYASVDARPRVPLLQLRRTSKGRGMVAIQDIAAGQPMVRVPMRHVISVREEGGRGFDGDARLATKLLLTLTADGEEGDEKDQRKWDLYARMLPTRTGCAALWEDEMIEEMQFLPAIESAFRLKERFHCEAERAMRERALPIHAMLWALSIVHSRSFAICTSEGERLRVLAPVADLFNHKADEPAAAGALDMRLSDGETGEAWRMVLEHDLEPCFQMCALEACKAGEEIFINYGHESNAELLISYGFLPEPNPSEFVPLYQGMSDLLDDDLLVDTPSLSTMQKIRDILLSSRSVEAPLAVRPGGIQSAGHLLGCLRVVHAKDHELGFLHEKFDRALGELVFEWETHLDGCPSQSRREEIERLAIRQCAVRTIELLAEFPSTLEEDEEILNELMLDLGTEHPKEGFGLVTAAYLKAELSDEDNSASLVDLTMAIRYRLQLKRILSEFLEEVLRMGFDEEELCMDDGF